MNIMNIRQKAMILSVSKAEARNVVEDIIDRGDNIVSNEELATLLAFFDGARKSRRLGGLDWVRKARDRKKYSNFQTLQVVAGKIIGTDGHRLHAIANDLGLEEGRYDHKTLQRIGQATITSQALQNLLAGENDGHVGTLDDFLSTLTPVPQAKAWRIGGSAYGISKKALDDALVVFDEDESTQVHYHRDKCVPVRIYGKAGIAVLVPEPIDDES